MNVQQYISHLERIQQDIPNIVDKFIAENSTYMVGAAKRRFSNYGVDGNGNLIGGGKYSKRTIAYKKEKGQRTSFVTLRDTGNWYSSLFAVYDSLEDDMYMQSTMEKLTSKLVDGEGRFFAGYGEGIMDFTEQEKLEWMDVIIERLINYLQEQFNTDIEIEL